jgi:molecular chaperone GrpE
MKPPPRLGMPDDKTDPREADEDQAKPADSLKAEAPTSADPESAVGSDLDTLLTENAEMRDRLLRTMADMENLRRRTEREKSDTARYAISNFARDVLTVGDNLKRTIEHVPAEAAAGDPALKSFLEGVELTERELLNALERHGVSRIEPLGQRFDPNCHQAMFEVDNPDVPEGTVVDVMQQGYMIGDRCLRPALVAVSKGGAKVAKPKGDGNGVSQRKAANDDFPEGWGGD